MKAAVVEGIGRVSCKDWPEPEVTKGKVLIRPVYAGICGSDLHVFHGEFGDRVSFPLIPGHEIAAVVEDASVEGTALKVGDRVVVDPVEPCRRCIACRTGQMSACRRLRLLGVDTSGGFAQRLAASAENVFPIPAEVLLRHAALVEPYAIGLHAVRRALIQPGEVVVIYGMGRLGLAVLEVVRWTGPSKVVAVDVEDFKLDIARRIGADVIVNARGEDPVGVVMDLTDGEGADRVIEAVGKATSVPGRRPPVTECARMIRPAGRVVVMGQGPEEESVDWRAFVWKEAEIVTSRVTLGEFPRAVQMLAEGKFHPDLLITHTFGLEEVARAYALAEKESPEVIKVQLEISGRPT